MKVNSWPKWLPYPSSWLRAWIVSQLYRYSFYQGVPEIRQSSEVISLIIGAWISVFPVVVYFHHWLMILLDWVATWSPQWLPGYAQLQNRLKGRQPLKASKWLQPSSVSWREGVNALIALLVVGAVTLGLYVLLYDSNDPQSARFVRKTMFQSMWSVGPIIMAYLYQYDLWVRQRRAVKLASQIQAKSANKSAKQTAKSTKPLPPINSTEQELNSLKAESGIAPARNVRDEIPQWHVFRSGQSKGPYTRQQLKDIQSITARTNVRRTGEESWTRAGDIQELANFLSTKN